MVVPSLAALLSDPPIEVACNGGPVLGTGFFDEAGEQVVFLLGPSSLDELGVEYLLPSVKALRVGATGDALSDLLPVSNLVVLDSVLQSGVLNERVKTDCVRGYVLINEPHLFRGPGAFIRSRACETGVI